MRRPTWALLISLSTLTTKQHYGYDVVAGAALGALAWKLSVIPLFKSGKLHEPTPHPS